MHITPAINRSTFATQLVLVGFTSFGIGLIPSPVATSVAAAFLYSHIMHNRSHKRSFRDGAMVLGVILLGVLLSNLALHWSDFLSGFREGYGLGRMNS